jgi:zinc D-Ala-D-Ala carboxypeptidase
MKKIIIYAMTCCLMSACQNTEKGQQDAASTTEQAMPQPTKINGEHAHEAQPTAQTALEMTETEGLVQQTVPFDKDYLMGKFDPNTHPDFINIAPQYASAADMRMRKDAYAQFVKMYEAAKKEGISLKIISATRPFHRQKSIWEAKWQGKRAVDGEMLAADMPSKIKALRILRWSSMPGTSRHHWGTDIDLNDLNNSYFETGKGAKIYAWLVKNAGTFGYCQVYSPKGDRRPNGYEEEKWHWSYLPVSRILTKNYAEMLENKDISGFIGSESAELIDVKTKYVLGINPDCE